MAGRGSLAGLLAYGDANQIVLEMANEVLPIAENSAVLAGVNGTDPFKIMKNFLKQIKDIGFTGVHGRGQSGSTADSTDYLSILEAANKSDLTLFLEGITL